MRWFRKQTCSFCKSVSYHQTGIATYEQWWHFSGYSAKSGPITGHGCECCSREIYSSATPKFVFRAPYVIQASWLPQLTVEQAQELSI